MGRDEARSLRADMPARGGQSGVVWGGLLRQDGERGALRIGDMDMRCLLRADCISGPDAFEQMVDLAQALRQPCGPRERRGPQQVDSREHAEKHLLREAVALGVDYIDLELDIASKIRRFGKTKRIVSYHNTKTTPVDLEDTADQCAEFDPDVVKIATAAQTLAEASRVLHIGSIGKGPTIPIAMGEIGLFTRILRSELR